jgi:hypothetical protein
MCECYTLCVRGTTDKRHGCAVLERNLCLWSTADHRIRPEAEESHPAVGCRVGVPDFRGGVVGGHTDEAGVSERDRHPIGPDDRERLGCHIKRHFTDCTPGPGGLG